MPSVSALAIVAARNEAIHIDRLLSDLTADGLEVIVLDNGSTDGTREIAETYLSSGVIQIIDVPWNGAFSLSDQLRAKTAVVHASSHDWIVHVDADEWLQSPEQGQTLSDGLAAADAAGANCINFNEFVFVPMPGEDFFANDYTQRMQRYYFFQPGYPRLMRAWKRSAELSNLKTGGHRLSGPEVRLFDTDFILRHYIVLSQEHAVRKYVGRTFSEEDIARGWHGNRVNLEERQMSVFEDPALKTLEDAASKRFDLTYPVKKHFWDWPS